MKTHRLVAAGVGVLGLLAAPDASAIDPPEPKERIEALEITASGLAGLIRTRPVTLVGVEGIYGFGEGACRAHSLAPSTLDALQRALRSGQPIRIHAVRVDPDAPHCVERVTFYAPMDEPQGRRGKAVTGEAG